MKNYEINIDSLKQSPIFNFSLSSKELFHSNFIDWLISINKKAMSEVFSNLLDPKQDIAIKSCNREKRNFDLYIDCQDNKQIIIENKFKSIISDQQLKKYNEKLEKIPIKNIESIKILLSLNLTAYEKKISNYNGWKAISYNELSKELKELLKKISNEYHKNIVADYCDYVDEISNYFKQRDYSKYKISDMHEEYKELSKVRLHDISQKILFNYILRELSSKLDNDKINYITGFYFSKEISLWQDFWRGTGLVSLNYTIKYEKNKKNEFRLELQLQHDAFKLMLIHDDPKKLSEEFKNNYFSIIENMYKEDFCKNNTLYPIRKGKPYKKYGENLIYKNIILSENVTISNIIELMYDTFMKVIEIGKNERQKL